MGIPSSASLANAPAASYPLLNPQGIGLSRDIRASMDGDESSYDVDPGRNNPDEPFDSKAETYLSRLAGYNNTTPDRGTLRWGRNKLPSRASSTEEVRMGDFSNFTTTTFLSSSVNTFDNFSNTKNNLPSSSIVDSKTSLNSWRNVVFGGFDEDRGTLYNIAYIDNLNDPRLGVLFFSGSLQGSVGANHNISQTGSNFQWDVYCTDINSSAIDTNATKVVVDNGHFNAVSSSAGYNYDDSQARQGCFYWMNGGTPYMVPYEFNSSSASPPGELTIHSSAQTSPSTTYGADIISAIAGDGVPGFTGGAMRFNVSSLLAYNGFSDLRARLFTISGSKAKGDSNIQIYSGSEYIVSNNVGVKDKCYSSLVGTMTSNGSAVNGRLIFGEGANYTLLGDDTVKICGLYLSSSTSANSLNAFQSNPNNWLDLKEDWSSSTLWGSSTEKYGAKCLINLGGQEPFTGGQRWLAVVAKSNKKIDVKLIQDAPVGGQGPYISGSLLNSIGIDALNQGLVNHTLPVSAYSLGVYTEYSSSLVEDPNSYEGSEVEYVVISYSIQANSFPLGPVRPATSVVKIYHNTGDIVYASTSDNVLNYESIYEEYNSWNISLIPTPNYWNPSSGVDYKGLHEEDYMTPGSTSKPRRNGYFITPYISLYNWSPAFKMLRRFLTIY